VTKAKSNVVNNNRDTPNAPPQQGSIDYLAAETFSFQAEDSFSDVETFLRNLAALGACEF
jgi:hypothetical protein